MVKSSSLISTLEIDETFKIYKDEGVFPGFGTFHMYHRIDGVLVAFSVLFLCFVLVVLVSFYPCCCLCV